ncbi:hypothetical protein [Pseudobacteriovorax antillogorgiicola]|uniref:Uncharacterized protein n=1 Tax=Pseudobacteriovorax antillogorgiicola TaxID=1513793 RepID=A0A1Y6CRC6_9BACT|nr:hypothetical protein [Pseudobacteriovorax antillogorgiicola]TCS42120.1 hypothetical protein EDD56_14411 [Pseudobacteriovorax antillogorgiicola]SMF83010.1 hypothetical protein SAMN06296036_1447 [Pseudobacteriovorax antillogorgiicola]
MKKLFSSSNYHSRLRYILLLSLAVFASCSEVENTPEKVDKLRAIGVATDSPYYEPGMTVTLTFILATPVLEDISVAEVTLEDELQLALSNISLPTPDDKSELRLYTVTADATLPLAGDLDFATFDGTANIAYALIFSQGAEEERVRGSIKIYPAGGSPTNVSGLPSIEITSPSENSTIGGGTVDLVASLDEKGSDENFRISWFVADGVIEKNRSIETEWEEMSAGTKTIIATARGLTSGTFAYDVIEATIE